jgi:hypothetical protein
MFMAMFRYEREQYEQGDYVRRNDAAPDNDLDPIVRIVEDLGTIEVPCGKVDCRANCIEYMVESYRKKESYPLPECKVRSLVSIL